jgi:hypothetical protein
MDPDDDIIYLFPISDSEIGGQPRGKTPAEQKILFQKGDVLTSKATIAMLYHGTLTPNGEEATLLIVDFRFLKDNNSDRFLNAKMRLFFRDLDEEDAASSPLVYRIAPEDSFSIEPGVDVWKITQTGKLGISGGYGGVSGKAEMDIKREGKTEVQHSILLTGKKKLETGGFLGETMAVWSLDEDKVKSEGIPTVLRTAVLLKRPPGRSFKIDTELETEVNWRAKFVTFLGRREHQIPLEEIEINPSDPTHVVVDGDEWLSEWIEKANEKNTFKNLGGLNLQDELVLVTNQKLMAKK